MATKKTVLITGGTGSFGKAFLEIALKEHLFESIRIFSRGEFLQQQVRERFNNDSRLRFFIGDVRDKARVSRAMDDVDIVVHAAALKQVPVAEYNPGEVVKTNICGTINIVDAAINNGIEKVIGLSSDKAVEPCNIYGATKFVAEKLIVQGNAYVGGTRNTRFSAVRYGNVAGSRGSVIPLFEQQRESGVLTITDQRMSRFWLTIEDAARFVLMALDEMQGGEIFVPKIKSMKILDIADTIAPNVEQKITGIRPGEKLHEKLISENESRHTRECDNFYVIAPETPFWDSTAYGEIGQALPEGFEYTSSDNPEWITKEDLRAMLSAGHKQ